MRNYFVFRAGVGAMREAGRVMEFIAEGRDVTAASATNFCDGQRISGPPCGPTLYAQ
jgi:hypothetical protein